MMIRPWAAQLVAFAIAIVGLSTAAPSAAAETDPVRVAIVGEAPLGAILDLATVALSEDPSAQLLERDRIDAIINEHQLVLSGLVDAQQAIRLGGLFGVELFGVLEMEPDGRQALGMVVFDAATGARLWDEALGEAPADRQSQGVAEAIRRAVKKFRTKPQSAHTVGLLSARNAELPRSEDTAVQALGRLLERRLVQDPNLAALERDRLQHVVRERRLPTADPPAPLAASLRLIDLEVARGAEAGQWKATAQVSDLSGRIIATVSAAAPAGDLYKLAHDLHRALADTLRAGQAADRMLRKEEAERFAREATLLWRHAEFARAAHAAEAAHALDPANERHLRALVYRLLDAAIELVDPGRQRSGGPPRQPIDPQRLEQSLGLARHALTLQHDLFHREIAAPHGLANLQEFSAINFPVYLSKIIAPGQAPPPAVQAMVAEFVAAHHAYQMDTVGKTLREAAHTPEGFRRYSAWVARPAMTDVFRHCRAVQADWHERAAQLLAQWAGLCEKQRASADPQLLVSSAFVFSEAHRLQRAAELSADEFQTLWQAYDALSRFEHPLLRHYGRLLALSLERQTGRIGGAELVEAAQELSAAIQRLAAPQGAPPPARVREVWIALAIEAHNLLPSEERTRWSRQLFKALSAQNYYSERLFMMAAAGSSASEHNRETLRFIDEALALLESQPDGIEERSRQSVVADLEARQRKLREALGIASGKTIPWKSVRTLMDVAAAESGIRALAAPVVDGRSAYAVGMSWTIEEGCVELTLLQFLLDQDERRVLGTFPIRDLPAPRPDRPSSRGEVTLYSVIERSTARGSDFLRDAVVAEGHYYAATMGRGILAFPLDGGDPRQIDEAAGLPSNYVQAMAYHEGWLYAWAGEPESAALLLRMRLDGQAIEVIASSRRSIARTPLDNTQPVRCDWMISDPSRSRILFRLTNSNSGEKLGLWELATKNGALRQLWKTPLFLESSTLARHSGEEFLLIRDGAELYRWDFQTEQARPIVQRKTKTPWMFLPIAVVNDSLWEAFPFGRTDLRTHRTEEFPPLREGTFQPGCFFQRLGSHELLLADPSGLWLIRLPSPQADPE